MDSNGSNTPLTTGGGITRRDFTGIAAKAFALAVAVPSMDAASGGASAAIVEDSLGRQVWLDGPVTKVSPLGVNAQAMITALIPSGLASLALGIEEDAEAYEDADLKAITELPKSGALCMSFGDPVSEQVLESAKPDLLLDAGLPREGLVEDLDALQREVGVPCLFLDIGFGKLASAYRTLGEMLFCKPRAEELAIFIETAQEVTKNMAARAGKPCRALYAPRGNGISVHSGIEVQLDAMRHVGIEPMIDAYDYEGKALVTSIAAVANPDLVVFGSSACLEPLLMKKDDVFDAWQRVPAIAQERFIVSPALMHSWFDSMTLVQSLGVLWLARVVWPDACKYDLVGKVVEFYRLFYGLEKTVKEIISLIGGYDRRGYAGE